MELCSECVYVCIYKLQDQRQSIKTPGILPASQSTIPCKQPSIIYQYIAGVRKCVKVLLTEAANNWCVQCFDKQRWPVLVVGLSIKKMCGKN